MNRSLGIVALVISVLSLSLVPVYGNAATAYIVSGIVSVPGGVIASNDKPDGVSLAGVLDFFVPTAEARLYGLVPVPNGTVVELVRMGDGGGTSAPIATTTTQYGRYRFNLSALRLTVSPRLIVRVSNVATGAQMRAFVTDKTVNINPVSETTVRMVLDTVASTQGGTLVNFTVTELEDLFGSLDLLTSSLIMRTDADIESSVVAVRNAVADNRGIVNFLTACARAGQTSAGPGDIGNYFPFTQGVSWTYAVQGIQDGIPSLTYDNTVKITGTRLINGVTTTVFKDSNPEGDGKPDYSYSRKISSGVFDWSPVKDGTRKTPYRSARFPAVPESSFKQSLGDMGLSKDLDRDGIIERFNFTATTTVLGLETVRVPAATLRNLLKIRTVATGTTTVSSTRKKMTVTATGVEWYAQNLGMAKQLLTYRITYDGKIGKATYTHELTEANGFPFTGDFPLDRWTTLNIESTDIVYERVSGKLFASVPSNAPWYANNVVVINPLTAKVESAIPVGTSPGPLAVSDDGQFLYVGLGGTQGSIRQVSIPTLTAGPEWMLSNIPTTSSTRYAYDIAVQPGNPEVLAVSTTAYPTTYPQDFSGAMMLDQGVERPISIPPSPNKLYHIVFSDMPTLARGYNAQGGVSTLAEISVTSDGMVISKTNAADFSFHDFKYDNDRIYTSPGKAYDAVTGNFLGDYISSYTPASFAGAYPRVEPNSSRNRVAVSQNVVGFVNLELFNLSSYVKVHELWIPPRRGEYPSPYPTHLESCATDGYAIRLQGLDPSTDQNYSRLVLTRIAQPN